MFSHFDLITVTSRTLDEQLKKWITIRPTEFNAQSVDCHKGGYSPEGRSLVPFNKCVSDGQREHNYSPTRLIEEAL